MHRHRVGPRSLVAVLVLLGALVAPLPSIAGSLGTPCAEASSTSVALVVDFGDVSGAGPRPAGVVTRCVPHTGGITGAEALVTAGFELRFGTSGLLCAIDGYPADGCGERTGDRRYRYWSYWKADGGDWEYAGNGPRVRLKEGVSEGWRFVEGTGSPNDPQPRQAPDHTAICGADPAPAPAPPPAAVAPDVVVPAASDGAPRSPGASATEPTAPSDGVDDPVPTSAPTHTTEAVPVDELALAATPTSQTQNAGSVIGLVAVGALIAALAAAAIIRTRRRA